MIRSKLSLSAAQISIFSRYFVFCGYYALDTCSRTLQHSAISVNVRFVVAFRAWIEAFESSGVFLLDAMLFMGFRALILYYSLACFGTLRLEKPFYLAALPKIRNLYCFILDSSLMPWRASLRQGPLPSITLKVLSNPLLITDTIVLSRWTLTYNLGQNKWEIKTTPPPISMMEKMARFD